jgi:hypothetical protein
MLRENFFVLNVKNILIDNPSKFMFVWQASGSEHLHRIVLYDY